MEKDDQPTMEMKQRFKQNPAQPQKLLDQEPSKDLKVKIDKQGW